MKKIAVLLIVLGFLVGIVPTVLADEVDNPDGTVTVTGTVAAIDTSNFVLPDVTLTRVDQSVQMQLGVQIPVQLVTNPTWEIRDPRGTGAGWSVTVLTTDFIPDTGAAAAKSKILPLDLTDRHSGLHSFFMRLDMADIRWVDGQFDSNCTDRTTCVGSATGGDRETGGDLMPVTTDFNAGNANSNAEGFVALSKTAQVLTTAVHDTGMGTYTYAPRFELDVPAETYAGHYTSTLTVTLIASAP
jgi:hypothetical protein